MRELVRSLWRVLGLWFFAYWLAKLFAITWPVACLGIGCLAVNSRCFSPRTLQQIPSLATFFLSLFMTLLGFQINLQAVPKLGFLALLLILGIVVGISLLGILSGKKLGLSSEISLFIALGSAICGASAIAAAAVFFPEERARQEAGISIGVISGIGMLGIFVLPWLIKQWDLGPTEAGLLVGGSLQSLAHVFITGFNLGPEVGSYAALIKMGRVLFIAPALLILGLWGEHGKGSSAGWRFLPRCFYGFLLALLVANSLPIPGGVLTGLRISSDMVMALALACLGLQLQGPLLLHAVRAFVLGLGLFTGLLSGLLLLAIFFG